MSRGQACYVGKTANLPDYFSELGFDVPMMMNPAEHVIDLINVDFLEDHVSQDRLELINSRWQSSIAREKLIETVKSTSRNSLDSMLVTGDKSKAKPGLAKQFLILLHRSFLKSYRDLVTYWVRLVMYMGLAFMMGTVWLRLSTDQAHIQPFINAIVSTDSLERLPDRMLTKGSSLAQRSCLSWLLLTFQRFSRTASYS
jgi:hypothetical protein